VKKKIIRNSSDLEKMWDFSRPEQCREFLKSVRIGQKGGQITHLMDSSGKELTIDEASDAQVLDLCKEIAEVLSDAKKSAVMH